MNGGSDLASSGPVNSLEECIGICHDDGSCSGIVMFASVQRHKATHCWTKGEFEKVTSHEGTLYHDTTCGKMVLQWAIRKQI